VVGKDYPFGVRGGRYIGQKGEGEREVGREFGIRDTSEKMKNVKANGKSLFREGEQSVPLCHNT